MLTPDEAAALVRQAALGDHAAWEKLVAAYGGLIWAVARSHRLDQAEAADVSQTTWLRLVQHLDTLREPARVGAWLATTARRECLNCLARSKREQLVAEPEDIREREPQLDGPEHDFLRGEREEVVRMAMAQLPTRCRVLLEMLMRDPPPDYRGVSDQLGLPVGSIGPTRGRCLKKLREIIHNLDEEMYDELAHRRAQ
jgi:RNA polymerase sigma factor (sigma-70 family)